MRTYAFSDIHGQYDLLMKVLDFCKPDDKIYFLGDAIDRGDRNLDCFWTLINDPRVTFLCGNHEDEAAQILYMEYVEMKDKWEWGAAVQNWRINGGDKTIEEFHARDKEHATDFIYEVMQLPVREHYINKKGQVIYLDHCGFTPFYAGAQQRQPLWDRNHFYDKWDEEKHPMMKNWFVVHGHTPVQALCWMMRVPETLPASGAETVWYGETDTPHKLDIDLGSFDSKRTVLVDLDTWEEHYFE